MNRNILIKERSLFYVKKIHYLFKLHHFVVVLFIYKFYKCGIWCRDSVESAIWFPYVLRVEIIVLTWAVHAITDVDTFYKLYVTSLYFITFKVTLIIDKMFSLAAVTQKCFISIVYTINYNSFKKRYIFKSLKRK